MSLLPRVPVPVQRIEKHRLEALSDGLYAIVLTLLVLELKVPAIGHGASERALLEALSPLLPKIMTWLLSFWVMALFWFAQCRLYRLAAHLDGATVRMELMQLALVSLLPFSTALIGEHGDHATAAAIYTAHLLAIALLAAWRTSHFIATRELHEGELDAAVARVLRLRSWTIVGSLLVALVLAFWWPGWNMLALMPNAFLWRARAS
jgi:uncharacterized membrane protein